ncbi:HPr family phosphocarrier protein [Aquella oligotrophica]|uniref:HPr family phosphocarrier protein n=1 Tax=Aquella oligotrophica TaxID=2067065 RepID=A0A2I7N6S4_9NEIS|nr:HPr family phosphocarrier protein [Aquella oligotrophica]AUR52142.1 HPr family phosphocarrier protein [Aquella oligotrophica]
MISKEIEVVNKLGLHARASSKLVQLANTFRSEIFIERNGRKANAKSIMSLMMLAASKGSQISIICSGEDEESALEEICQLFTDRFGENE